MLTGTTAHICTLARWVLSEPHDLWVLRGYYDLWVIRVIRVITISGFSVVIRVGAGPIFGAGRKKHFFVFLIQIYSIIKF